MKLKEYKQKVIDRLSNMDEWGKVILERELTEDNGRTVEYAFSQGFSVSDAALYIFYTVQPDELENCPLEEVRTILTEDYCIKRMSEIQKKYPKV